MQDALLLLAIAGAAAGVWYWSVAGRERVLAISAEICRDLDVQRLDDSVALRGVKWRRGALGAIERRYEFEFSTNGLDRRRGEIVLHGLVLQRASLELPDGPLLIDVAAGTPRDA